MKAQEAKESAEDELSRTIRLFDKNQARVEAARADTNRHLEELGRQRLKASDELIRPYVEAVQHVHRVEQNALPTGEVSVQTEAPSLDAMRVLAYEATDLLKDGIVAVPAGVLAGIGAAGTVSTLGAASTGTAIASLSGVAASNATLAWLGGGSLAAGGWGVAGGTAVLGGVVLGPVIAVTGLVAAAKLEKQITEIDAKRAEYLEANSQLDGLHEALRAVDARIAEIQGAISDLALRFAPVSGAVQALVARKQAEERTLQGEAELRREAARRQPWWTKLWRLLTLKRDDFSYPDPLDFNSFSEAEKQVYIMGSRMAMAMYSLLKTPVLESDGGLSTQSEACVAGAQELMLAGA